METLSKGKQYTDYYKSIIYLNYDLVLTNTDKNNEYQIFK